MMDGPQKDQRPYDQWNKQELYELARSLGVRGRSQMTKSELVDALRGRATTPTAVPGPHLGPRRIGDAGREAAYPYEPVPYRSPGDVPPSSHEESPERSDGRPPGEDALLRECVRRALVDAPDIEVRDLHVNVRGGTVELSGTVDGPHVRRAAGELAEMVGGVRGVRNSLRVVNLRA
jgi:hypothetical protein